MLESFCDNFTHRELIVIEIGIPSSTEYDCMSSFMFDVEVYFKIKVILIKD